MKPGERQELARWLEAEQSGADDAAEEVLTALFRSIPRHAPRAGFSDRVLLAAAPHLRGRSSAWSAWWTRAAIVATLLACGLTAALIPVGELSPLAAAWARLVPLAVDVSVGTIRWLHRGIFVWRAVAGVGSAGGLVLATPPALAVLAANIALAIGLAGALKRLLSPGEEWSRC